MVVKNFFNEYCHGELSCWLIGSRKMIKYGQREAMRGMIARTLMYLILGIYALAIIVGAILIFFSKIIFQNYLDMILAVSATIFGFLGITINFYFSKD